MTNLLSKNKGIGYINRTVAPAAALASIPFGLSQAPGIASSILHNRLSSAVGLATSIAGGNAVNKVSNTLTGKDWGTNVGNILGTNATIGEITNPGYFIGGQYGNFVGNNFANRGRYTLNYLFPARYDKSNYLTVAKTLPHLFYEAPPSFANGRKPKWYTDALEKGLDVNFLDSRFENGLVWAGIPEAEAPHPNYIMNKDGSYRLTSDRLALNEDGSFANSKYFKDAVYHGIDIDRVTKGRVGGDHSDYMQKGIISDTDRRTLKILEFYDHQKLNPQWQIAE